MLHILCFLLALVGTLRAQQNVTVHPSRASAELTFSGFWEDVPVQGKPWCPVLSEGWRQTNELGSNVTFTFTGTAVYAFGHVHGNGSVSFDVTLDGVTTSQEASSESGCGPLFSSSQLTDGDHQIMITLRSTSPDAYFGFYAMMYTTFNPDAPPTGNSSITNNSLENILKGCGKNSTCVFRREAAGGNTTQDIMVGKPVGNCNGGTEPIVSVVGEATTITEGWGVGASIGFMAFGLRIGAEGGYQQSTSKTLIQTLEFTIKPGFKVAMIARTPFAVNSGQMRVTPGTATTVNTSNSTSIPMFSFQPGDTDIYDIEEISCNEEFTAIRAPPKPSAAARLSSHTIFLVLSVLSGLTFEGGITYFTSIIHTFPL